MARQTQHLDFDLPDPEATCALARRLGQTLRPGDTVLLAGGLGAGKSHFARCLIRSRLPVPEDVPSPTFTLVQTYDVGDAEIWHSDLYRLSGPSEIDELGLWDALDHAICLVEWPDRMGDLVPADALTLTLSDGPTDDARKGRFSWAARKWDSRLQAGLA